jgi:hypothetical protein
LGEKKGSSGKLPVFLTFKDNDLTFSHKGVLLINAIENWPPLVSVTIPGSNTQRPGGLFPEVLHRIQAALNFTIELVWPEDQMWGSGQYQK